MTSEPSPRLVSYCAQRIQHAESTDRFSPDIKTLIDIISEKMPWTPSQQDDKTMLMERTIQLVSGLPDHSKTQEILTNSFIDKLWNSLDHPPMIYVGPESKYRRPDGYGNVSEAANPILSEVLNQPASLGLTQHRTLFCPSWECAGTPTRGPASPRFCNWERSRIPRPSLKLSWLETGSAAAPTMCPAFSGTGLPLLSTVRLTDRFFFHLEKSGSSANEFIDLFWTDLHDQNKNDTSSYLDLAPLYGNSQEAQDSIRTFKDGKLKPDTFADKRMHGNPPGVCVLLIMFNRFHNHVATTLADINEGNRFPKPTPDMSEEDAAKAWKNYDEELFQTARLVTSGLYINITLVDYVRNIVNLNRADTTWTLDPRQEMGVAVGTKEGSEAGVGNVVSAEFNLCYRWHSCISEMDEKWTEDFFKSLIGEHEGDLDLKDLIMAMKKFEMSIPEEPAERTFNGFKRGPDGSFSDDDLMDALATAIEQPGGAFGGRNVPRVMKPIEMMGIIRGRRWNLAGLNEFRKHFGLKAYDTFEELNSDPVVADALRNLYQHPDNVELYTGIVAEEAKDPMVPGVGITPTYTISRVVLSDAVSLVRGDRYYTTDYHPGSLTNFGYKEVDYDLNVNHGCVFYKLFIRAFPDHFKGNSVYAHYPMVTPDENKRILVSLKRDHLFDFERPAFKGTRTSVTSYGGAKHILDNSTTYKVDYKPNLNFLMGRGKELRVSDLKTDENHSLESLLDTQGGKDSIKSFYSMISERLLSEKSYKIAGRTEVDLVRDVGNLAHTHLVSRMFNIPLKTRENPKGVFSELELYTSLSTIFNSLFFDVDPAKSFPLRQAAQEMAEKLCNAIEMGMKLGSLGFGSLFGAKPGNDPLSQHSATMVKAMKKAGLSAQDIAWGQILPTASAMVPNQAQMVC